MAPQHAGQGRAREPRHGKHVQPDQVLGGFRIELRKWAIAGEACIVDQKLDVAARGAGLDFREVARVGQVGWKDFGG